MGRVETAGMVLVDLEETMEILDKSRSTVFRLVKASELIKVDVSTQRTLYITLESIDRYRNHGPQFVLRELEPVPLRNLRRRELEKNFPRIFKPPL